MIDFLMPSFIPFSWSVDLIVSYQHVFPLIDIGEADDLILNRE